MNHTYSVLASRIKKVRFELMVELNKSMSNSSVVTDELKSNSCFILISNLHILQIANSALVSVELKGLFPNGNSREESFGFCFLASFLRSSFAVGQSYVLQLSA